MDSLKTLTKGRLLGIGLLALLAGMPAAGRAQTARSAGRLSVSPPAWVKDALIIKMDWENRENWTPDNSWREMLMREYDPDFIAWSGGAYLNAGRWFTMRGVRVAGAANTGYFTEINLDNPRVERLAGNGIQEPYRWTSHFDVLPVCPIAPKARGFCPQHLFGNAAQVDMLCQDNICFSCAWCNCRWCTERFRNYLQKKYPPDELKALGVADAATFEFSALGRLAAPARKELSRARSMCNGNQALLEIYEPVVAEIKRLGRRHGKELPFYGNQGNHFGRSPMPVAITPLVDAMFFEAGHEQPQYEGIRKAWGALGYKIAAAAGNYEKPAWHLFGGPDACFDAAANGAVMSDPTSKEFLRFANSHRSLLLRRQRRAQVALVWSLPSILANRGPFVDALLAAGTVLENAHIPYEAVVFGHSELMDDRHLERLSHYDVLVLPSVTAVNDAQAEALRRFLETGKAAVVIGDCAIQNENGKASPAPRVSALKGLGRRTVAGCRRVANVAQSVVQDYLKEPFRSVAGDPSFAAMRDSVLWALQGEPEVTTTAPETVWLNVWEHEAKQKISVHLVDYAASPTAPAGNFTLSLRPPAGFRCDRVRLISFGNKSAADLPVARRDGRLQVVVPAFNGYAIVVFTSGCEMEAAEALAQGRKLLDRVAVASGGTDDGPATKSLSSLFAEAERQYAAGQFAIALAQATDVQQRVRIRLDEVIQSNVDRERNDRLAILARGAKAARAFDFGAGPLAQGFSPVAASTAYEPSRGFGWENVDPQRSDGAAKVNPPDALHQDWVAGREDAVFLADLPNDDYRVTVLTGDTMLPSYRHFPKVWCDGRTNVYANDELMLLGIPRRADVFEAHCFPIRITGGQLRLTIQRRSEGPWQINGLLVERTAGGEGAERAGDVGYDGQDALRRHAIRDWLVLGPFDDSDATALGREYSCEKAIDLREPQEGKQGPIRWLHYSSPSRAGFCRVGFDRLFWPDDEVMAFAATHIHAPRPAQVRLFFGSTGRAVGWLNGEEILRDLKTDGLAPDEETTTLNLKPGWNRLLVKVCNNWSKEWAFAASLGAPAPESKLRISALGDLAGDVSNTVEVQAPKIRCPSAFLELGGKTRIAVLFRNTSQAPCGGVLRVALPPRLVGAAQVEPDRVEFVNLLPGQTATGDFTLSLMRPVARKTAGPCYTGPRLGGEARIAASLRGAVVLAGIEYQGEPQEFRIVQPKLRLWSQSSIATHQDGDTRMDLISGGTFFGCDWEGSIYTGIAKYRGLCSTTTGILHAIPGDLPATRFCTLMVSSQDSKFRRCGALIPQSIHVSQEGNAETLSYVHKNASTAEGVWQTETKLTVRGTLPALFVTVQCRNVGERRSSLAIHAEGRHPHWGSRELEAYATANDKRVCVEPCETSGHVADRWSGFDPAAFVPRGKQRKIVSDGWAFLHTKGGPGYGLLVPGRAGLWYDETRRPFITTLPERQAVEPGDAVTLSYVLVNAENPAELAAIVGSFPAADQFAGNVLVGNPLPYRLEGTLSVKLPEGYTATPADAAIVLDPGESRVCGFRWSGPKPPVAGLPVEAVFRIPAVGELRESGTLGRPKRGAASS